MPGSFSDDGAGTAELSLRAAVEWAPSGLMMVDADGRIVLVNREIERLFGYSREELQGKPVEALVPERFRAHHPGFRGTFLSNPRVRAMGAGRDLFGLRKDGTEVPVEIGLTPVVTQAGMFVLSSIVDISARKAAEARFRAAVESAPSGMVMVDEAGTIVLVNREVERLFGYTRSELLGQSVDLLVPERFRSQHPGVRAKFYLEPQARRMGGQRELFGLRKDGSEVPIEIGLNPIQSEEGMFVLSSIVDISERKAAEAKRRGLEEQLRQSQKLEAVGTLAGGIAHDFNNLLGGIIGYAELAREQLTEKDAAAEDLEQILRAALRGRDIVEHLLRFSRRQDTVLKPISLAPVITEGLRLLRATIPSAIVMETNVQTVDCRALADATSTHQVLINLVTNSSHAMPGGGTLKVSLGPFYVRDSFARAHPDLHEGPYVRLSVADSGVGMDTGTRERIFEPFFTTRAPGIGSGLGMAVVHGIMQHHRGGIVVESQLGKGTTVDCFFPALPDAEDEKPLPARETPPGRGERILCVDDEPLLAETTRRRLTRLGYQVTICTNPRAAVEQLKQNPDGFDLVLSDYTMPEMTGHELASVLAQLGCKVPVILITGVVGDLPETQLLAPNVCGVVRKPLTRDELATAVRRGLAGEVAGKPS
jgi:PAS domain S-box-containing protein